MEFISLWEGVEIRCWHGLPSSQACGFAVIGLRCLKLHRYVVYFILFLPVSRSASASSPPVATWLRSWEFILLLFNHNCTCVFHFGRMLWCRNLVIVKIFHFGRVFRS